VSGATRTRTPAERARRRRTAQAFAARDSGRPLAAATRARLEPLLGADLASVRVHEGERAEAAARAVGASGFALGEHVVVAAGERDEALLAHELAHVVQQRQPGGGGDGEPGAREAAARVTGGRTVDPRSLGAARVDVHAQDEEHAPRAPRVEPRLTLNWDDALLRPPIVSTTPLLPPPTPAAAPSDPAPSLPSRLSLLSSGRFSLGLRLGFPEAEDIAGAPPSALKESLARSELINQQLTGNVPRGWDAIDKAQLAQAVWGIFSTNIAPDVARSITRGLTRPAGPAGISYQLDLVLLTDFSGGGLTFTLRH
jgi:Domain of unknown function (DUF4157)